MIHKEVTFWFDDWSGAPPGWVARCSEYDDRGRPIAGRVSMDRPIYARTTEQARLLAAEEWGVPVDEVRRLFWT
jgi:hypothetical protein